jgi:hypothetical protein
MEKAAGRALKCQRTTWRAGARPLWQKLDLSANGGNNELTDLSFTEGNKVNKGSERTLRNPFKLK